MKRLLFVLTVISLSSMLIINPAFAAALYSVVANDDTSIGKNAWGVSGSNYIMTSPTIKKLHVSSIYVFKNPTGDYWAEVGWCWHSNYNNPRYFGAYCKRGLSYEVHFGDAPKNSNHSYSVEYVNLINKWRWKVDGSTKMEQGLEGWCAGYALASSERNDSGETNYSHFWNLKKRDSSGNWSNWSALKQYKDNDPSYYLKRVTDSECYMQN